MFQELTQNEKQLQANNRHKPKNMKSSRNALCPCGSGKKYKRCCGVDIQAFDESPDESIVDKLKRAINDIGATTIDEMNEIAQRVNAQHNERSIKEFLGLSPAQMSNMLYKPLESPDLVTFNEDWFPKESQALQLFSKLADAIGQCGVKATNRGNLPIKLCREIFVSTPDEFEMRPPSIRTEREFDGLHTIRLVGELAGLIEKRKSYFVLTCLGKEVTQSRNQSRLFHALFKSYATTFNWAYRDGYPEVEIIQIGWLFSLYCLSLFGDKWRPCRFYGERFLQAFPDSLKETDGGQSFSCDQRFYQCYQSRSLRCFAHFWGLVGMKKVMDSKNAWFDFELKAIELSEWLQFHG